MKEDSVETHPQETPKQVPYDAEPPAGVEGENAVAAVESQRRNVGAAECDASLGRLMQGQQLEIAELRLDSEAELPRVDRKFAAARHPEPAERGMNAGADVEMHVGRGGEPPVLRLNTSKHGEEFGKEEPIVAFNGDATIGYNCRRCPDGARLTFRKAGKETLEQGQPQSNHAPLRPKRRKIKRKYTSNLLVSRSESSTMYPLTG